MSETRRSGRTGTDFIRQIVTEHVREGRYDGIVTRFPPEPNGYPHIGHAKSVCLNFGIAREFGGRCHLRFDDTNPETEELEYVEAIKDAIRWLGFDWGEHLYFASDYFERMYDCAVILIEKGLAYVDSSTEEEIRQARGTVTEPGRPTAFRDRAVEENLDLFRRMRDGEYPDGAHVLRGKIDLASPNMLMRDPVFYRIRHAHHYRRGDAWCIYPLYDYAHCLEDAFEGVTHSLCTLEFDNNREIYDWILDNVGFQEPRTHQYEFNRLNLEYTVVSKRKLGPLVKAGHVAGWDDPRMSTLAGLRRRGVPPEAVRLFAEMVGVAKTESWVDPGKLEFAIRDVLNRTAPRVMAVLHPLKVVITNLAEGDVEELDAPYWPHDVPLEGSRKVPFGRELLIERDDFAEDPPKGFRRLVPGGEVRLRYGYVIRCDQVVKGPDGRVLELRCTYDPDTRSGSAGSRSGRKGLGTVHWVSAAHALAAEVRLYDRLFKVRNPEEVPEGGDLVDNLNPESLVVVRDARIEPSVASDPLETRYQFERTGYFWRDPVDGVGDALVFNRIVTLKDTWSRQVLVEGTSEVSAEIAKVERPPEDATQTRDASDPDGKESEGAGTAGARSGRRREVEGTPERPRVSDERAGRRRADPELAARMERYVGELGLSPADADILTGSRAFSDFFEAALGEHGDATTVGAWVVNDVRGVLGGGSVVDLPFDGAALGRLARLVDEGTVSRRAAKDILAEMATNGGDPATLVVRLGLEKLKDTDVLAGVVDEVLARWPDKVAEYRDGNANLMGLFVGEVMKATRGAADPKAVRALIAGRLGDGS